ncbi:pantoate--beta-alanine ligase [Chenggangzhangella methanolivorans]|uniref:pantoate--beta-alanine ligase n=1 Tax=Chenggangzhangella methanolivorans TaxID=1437009 RepID=UPI0036198306
MKPEVVSTVTELRARVAGWRAAGERVALVPTMGALHAGHLALVTAAAAEAARVVVTIFVNPTQFAPHEDLATYPRDLDKDLAALAGGPADLVFAPDAAQMYPAGAATTVAVGGPSEGLESVARPHFFGGVATVVTKLLIQAGADVACFGEKDFQQLAVVRRLARDLCIATEIRGVPTVREADGLAMSSRNVYLDADARAKAPAIHRAMRAASAAIADGAAVETALADARAAIEAEGMTIDYLELRDEETLAPLPAPAPASRRGRLLAAVRLSGVRLIDNISVGR